MQTTVERIDDTTIKLSVTVEAERVDASLENAARRLASEVRVPGFRPGRVPRRVLESRLGKDAVVAEAVRDALPAFYADAVEAESLSVVSNPEFDIDTFEGGKDAHFTATVEVRPDIPVPEIDGLQIPHPDWEVTDEDLTDHLRSLQERFAELETVERPARPGDYVVITVTATADGRTIEQASGDDVLYEIGEAGEDGPELDRQLAGATAGGILRFSDELGPAYGELAGTRCDFSVIVKEVKERRLPPLDDDFALTASEFDTLDELKESLRSQLALSKLSYATQALRGKVVEAVSALVEVPLPRSLVESELHFQLGNVSREAEQHGLTLDQYVSATGTDPQQLMTDLEASARATVKAQLVIDAVGRAAGVDVEQADLAVEVARQASRLGRPASELAQLMTSPERIGALLSDAFRRKTIDHLLARVAVLSGPPPGLFDELAGRARAESEAQSGTASEVAAAADDAEE